MGKQETNQDNFLGKLFFENRVRKVKKKCIRNNSFWNREPQDHRMTQFNITGKTVCLNPMGGQGDLIFKKIYLLKELGLLRKNYIMKFSIQKNKTDIPIVERIYFFG